MIWHLRFPSYTPLLNVGEKCSFRTLARLSFEQMFWIFTQCFRLEYTGQFFILTFISFTVPRSPSYATWFFSMVNLWFSCSNFLPNDHTWMSRLANVVPNYPKIMDHEIEIKLTCTWWMYNLEKNMITRRICALASSLY
jgi:hypothetical protein